MNDPQLQNSQDLHDSTNVSNLTEIPEFSLKDGTYEHAVRVNYYDFKLYRHAIYRNCISLRKAKSVQDCEKFSSSIQLRSISNLIESYTLTP